MTKINITSKLSTENDALQRDLYKIEEIMNNLDTLTNVPSTSASVGKKGQIKIDSSYIYVCTATNTWKRTALSAF